MRHHFTHFVAVVSSAILLISGVIVSCLEISEQLSVPKPYDDVGSKSLYRPGGRTLNSNPPPKLDPEILAFPDGMIHFKGKNSEEVLWSLPTGGPLCASYRDGQNKFDYIECGDNGELHWHTKHGGTMNVPVTIEKFISSTPHISEDGGVLLGSKTSTVLLVDAKSGELIHTYRSDSSSKTPSDVEKSVIYDGNVGKLIKSFYMEREDGESPLYVTRTDYSLDCFAPNSPKVLWKMTFAQIRAASICSHPELGSQLDMSLPCQSERPVKHHYRKHPLLELHGLPEAHNDSVSSPMLTSQLLDKKELPASATVDMIASQSKTEMNSEVAIYHHPSEIENSGTSDSHGLGMYYVVFGMLAKVPIILYVVLVTVILVGFVFRRYALVDREEIELDKQSSNTNAKVGSSKRKKNRKSGKNNGSVEIKDRQLLSENEHGRRIGKLCVSSVEIAKGSNGTVVLEGIFEGRPVAVKRLVQAHHDVAFKEIQNLIASDRHPNIVRWYGVEYDQDFVYLSLERCTCSLDDLIQICSDTSQNEVVTDEKALRSMIEYKGLLDSVKGIVQDVNLWKANGHPSPLLLKLMRDVVSGLLHLHELGIIHRDLKPQNVLIIKEKSLCAKLSDMGISRRLLGDMSSLGHHATGCGSSGWQAPEQLLNGRQTRAVDLFSLGCVLFFCITGGKHPFGDRLERDINIVKNQMDLFLVECIPEAVDLFSHLLNPDPELRPKTLEVVCHPLFWSSEMRLSFLRDTSDRVELEDRETNSDILNALESIAPMALGAKWDEKMEPAFISNIGRYRRYKYDSVRDLLRVMRNKLNHYRELPKDIQELLGSVPEGFDEYFASRFPKLLIEVYKVVHTHCRGDECFQKYFKAL